MQGIGRGEVFRRQNRGFGQRQLLPFDAEQFGQHPFTHIAQIERTGRQQGIGNLLEFVDPGAQRPLPGPGGAMSLHDRDQRIPHQHRIGQQFALGGKDRRFGGAETLTGAPFQFLALGAHRQQRLLQRFAFGHYVARLIANLEALGDMAHQLADRQSGTGSKAVNRARRSAGRPFRRDFSRGQRVAAGALGIGLFYGGQPAHGFVQRIQGALGVGTARREPQGRAASRRVAPQVTPSASRSVNPLASANSASL